MSMNRKTASLLLLLLLLLLLQLLILLHIIPECQWIGRRYLGSELRPCRTVSLGHHETLCSRIHGTVLSGNTCSRRCVNPAYSQQQLLQFCLLYFPQVVQKHITDEVETWTDIWRPIVSEIFLSKITQNDNLSSSYSLQYQECFGLFLFTLTPIISSLLIFQVVQQQSLHEVGNKTIIW